MPTRRFDLRTFAMIFGAAIIGALWANYNRELAPTLATEDSYQPRVWVIFATPFAMFLGWFAARRTERWIAAFVCFCVYFFSPFVAARYESCAVLTGGFNLSNCFLATSSAQDAARGSGHILYFQTIIVVHLIAALVIALRQARSRSTIQEQTPLAQHEPLSP